MYCPTCGKELYDNGEDRFNCPFCGAEVVGSGSETEDTPEETLEERCKRLERELARQKLKAEIEGHNITQARLAKLSGVSVHTLSNLETGVGNVTLDTLLKVANTVGFKVRSGGDYILKPVPRNTYAELASDIPANEASWDAVEGYSEKHF